MWPKSWSSFGKLCRPKKSCWAVATLRSLRNCLPAPEPGATKMHFLGVFEYGRKRRMPELELLPESNLRNMAAKTLSSHRKADPCILVIFGGAGDLTKRKLVPALCNLAEQGFLPQQFGLVVVSYTDLTTESLRELLTEDIKTFALRPVDPAISTRLIQHTYYVRGEFGDAATYQKLRAALSDIAKEDHIPGNHFYYLAVAPRFFGEIVKQLGAAGLAREENGQWRRVVIEKPFGRGLQSARSLNTEIKQVLDEHQIYRIDHYLGK